MKFHLTGDELYFHNHMQFTTYDVDNDLFVAGNCARYWGNGGNWYNTCLFQNMNGLYGANGDAGDKFMWWKHYDMSYYEMSLKSMRWMVREVV